MPEVVKRTVDSLSEQFRHVRHGNLSLCHNLKKQLETMPFKFSCNEYAVTNFTYRHCNGYSRALVDYINDHPQTGECQLRNC
jgi:hypothetical protein